MQVFEGFIDPAGIDDPLVTDNEGFGGSKAQGALADLTERAGAENDFRSDEFTDVHWVSPLF